MNEFIQAEFRSLQVNWTGNMCISKQLKHKLPAAVETFLTLFNKRVRNIFLVLHLCEFLIQRFDC